MGETVASEGRATVMRRVQLPEGVAFRMLVLEHHPGPRPSLGPLAGLWIACVGGLEWRPKSVEEDGYVAAVDVHLVEPREVSN